MPAKPLIVPNAVQVRLQFVRSPNVWNVVMFAAKNGAVTVDQNLANSVSAAIKSGFTSSGAAAVMGTAVSLNGVFVRDVSTANLAEFVGAGSAVAGTATGDLLPTSIALCITHRTARAGKSFRGRSYHPGFTELNSDAAGHCVQAAVDAVVAFYNSVRTSIVAQSLTLGVASRQKYHPDGSIAAAGFITPITTSVSRNNSFETQRRRAT